MENFLCFDLGTTRIKSALIDYYGNIVYSSERKPKTYNDDNCIYQKPEEYYDIVLKEIQEIKKNHPLYFRNAGRFICSGQMAGILSIDKNWEVIIPWTYSIDTRANKYLDYIESKMASRIRNSSGGVPFMAAKMKWIKNEFPFEYKKSYKFINLTTYVAGRLAGMKGHEAFIDYSVLGMSGLADIINGRWNRNIIEDIDLCISKLPKIFPPFKEVGTIPKEKFGTKNDIKVLAGIGDQIAGFIGAGILKMGDLVDVAGTYTVLGYSTDRFIPDPDGRAISSIYSGIEDIYYQMAVVAIGGYLFKWFTEKFNYDAGSLDRIMETGDLYFIPHIGGRTTPPQPFYHGTLYGLKWDHNLDSIYISMLECLGFEYDLIYRRIKNLEGSMLDKKKKIKVIGGGNRNYIWNEIKSNILGFDYMIMEDTSFEILGNYLIARYGNNVRKGYRNLLRDNKISILKYIKPDKQRMKNYIEKKERYSKIVNRLGEIYRELG